MAWFPRKIIYQAIPCEEWKDIQDALQSLQSQFELLEAITTLHQQTLPASYQQKIQDLGNNLQALKVSERKGDELKVEMRSLTSNLKGMRQEVLYFNLPFSFPLFKSKTPVLEQETAVLEKNQEVRICVSEDSDEERQFLLAPAGL